MSWIGNDQEILSQSAITHNLYKIISEKDSFDVLEFDPSISIEEQLLMYTVLDIELNSSLNYPRSLDEIYLTRLAVATMGNTGTTEPYSTMQKQDVVEIIELGDGKTKTNVSYLHTGENLQISSNRPPKYPNMFKTKQKISLIGRPKPYNMEDLNDIDYKTESKLIFSR